MNSESSDMNPTIGDILSVQKGPFVHVGVVVAGGVLQNSLGGKEEVVPFKEFARGRQVTLHKTYADPWLVQARARDVLIAPRPYNALWQNCEHTANEVVFGTKRSPQVAGLFLGLFVGLIATAALYR